MSAHCKCCGTDVEREAYVYYDQKWIGVILKRDLGFEAIDPDEQSLGLFQTQHEAKIAIFRAMLEAAS